ncbi:MAG: DUF393 domain-containing protein [Alteraurantiacibacter sp.]
MADVTVWFDGACPLCRREIAGLRKLDRREAIDFVDISSGLSEGEPQGCPVSSEDLSARFHAREGDRLLSGAAAFAAMWRAIPILRPMGEIARIPPVLWVLERLYRRFLIIRPYLQIMLVRRDAL